MWGQWNIHCSSLPYLHVFTLTQRLPIKRLTLYGLHKCTESILARSVYCIDGLCIVLRSHHISAHSILYSVACCVCWVHISTLYRRHNAEGFELITLKVVHFSRNLIVIERVRGLAGKTVGSGNVTSGRTQVRACLVFISSTTHIVIH